MVFSHDPLTQGTPNTRLTIEDFADEDWDKILDVYRSLDLDAPKIMPNYSGLIREEAKHKINPHIEIRPQSIGRSQNKVVFTKRRDEGSGAYYLHVEIFPNSYCGPKSVQGLMEEFDKRIRELFR